MHQYPGLICLQPGTIWTLCLSSGQNKSLLPEKTTSPAHHISFASQIFCAAFLDRRSSVENFPNFCFVIDVPSDNPLGEAAKRFIQK